MYGNQDNMVEAIMNVNTSPIMYATLIVNKDMRMIDEALHLIEKYKKLGVNDYDALMIWITQIKVKES